MDLKLSDEMTAAVAEYAERSYDVAQSSSQTKEELHRLQEENDQIAKEYQWLTEDEYQDLEQRTGRVMHSSTFLNKLNEAGIRCWYTAHPLPRRATLVVPSKDNMQPPEVACWVQEGFMPELSFMRFDEHGAPLDERRRGWRTPLLQLILKGIISEQLADATFGPPKQTGAFDRYNRTLWGFRNNGSSLY